MNSGADAVTRPSWSTASIEMIAVGREPTPSRRSAESHRFGPLGQSVTEARVSRCLLLVRVHAEDPRSRHSTACAAPFPHAWPDQPFHITA